MTSVPSSRNNSKSIMTSPRQVKQVLKVKEVRDLSTENFNLTPFLDWTLVRNFCHTIPTIVLTEICIKHDFSLVFLSVYVEIVSIDKTTYNICVNCFRDIKPKNLSWKLHHNERCYFHVRDAQIYNMVSKCTYCHMYFAKMRGESHYQFCFEGLNEEEKCRVVDCESFSTQDAVDLAYHY